MRRRDFVTSGIAMAGAALSGEGQGDGPAGAGVLPPAQVHAADRPATRLDATLFRTRADSRAQPDGDSRRWARSPWISGRKRPPTICSFPDRLVESLVMLQARLAEDAEFLQASVGLLDSSGCGACICPGGEFTDVSICRLAKIGGAQKVGSGCFNCARMRVRARRRIIRKSQNVQRCGDCHLSLALD